MTEQVAALAGDGARRTEAGTRTVALSRGEFEAIATPGARAGRPRRGDRRREPDAARHAEASRVRMVELAGLAEARRSATQQVAASTQETAATAGQLSSTAERLDKTAGALEGLVVQFTVGAEHRPRALGDLLAGEAEVLVERLGGR